MDGWMDGLASAWGWIRLLTHPINQSIDPDINRQNGYDVVLVDTAGRMQNKEPLMRALAKLVSDNEPDLCLFVGEALVGNDGIDQLAVFNQALANYSPPGACVRACVRACASWFVI